jgi:hypothetical protein
MMTNAEMQFLTLVPQLLKRIATALETIAENTKTEKTENKE